MLNYLQRTFALSEQGAKDFIKACFACVFGNLMLMFPVTLLFFLVDDMLRGAVPAEKMPLYVGGILLGLILIAFSTFLQYNATYFATYKESGVRRIALAEKLRKLPLAFFARKDLSDLTSTIMADCAFLEQSFSHFIPELVGAVVSTTLVAVGLFFFDWRLALATLWVLPISFAIVALSAKIQDYFNGKQMAAKMDLADGIQEGLEAIKEIKTNNAEERYLAGLDQKIKAVEKRAIISELSTGVFVLTAQLILKLGIATVALVGGALLSHGSLPVLSFFLFLLVASRLYDPMQAALTNLAATISTRTHIKRMNETFDQPSQEGSTKLTNKGYDIVFDKVGFSYDSGKTVLRDVSFTARQGQVTALIGPSGSGKTTVTRLAARFWDADRGKISVGGMDIAKIDPETLLSLYSIVFQEVTLFNNTVMENIRIGRKDASDEEVLRAASYAHCDEFVSRLPGGWQTKIGENGAELSGGERQRISIARAFLKNAPIVLLDEATASLDVENETMIQTAISRLIKDKTVVVIAHRLRTIAAADQIIVLKDGEVQQKGSPAQLGQQNGLYRDMARLQHQTAEVL